MRHEFFGRIDRKTHACPAQGFTTPIAAVAGRHQILLKGALMRASSNVVFGRFEGGELEPGTFHRRHLPAGLFVPVEETPDVAGPTVPQLRSAPGDHAVNARVVPGSFFGGKTVEDGVFHHFLVGGFPELSAGHPELESRPDLTRPDLAAGKDGLHPPVVPPDQNAPSTR